MKLRSKKDIIIPAGTVFEQAPRKTERDANHAATIIGFGDNASGDLTVAANIGDAGFDDWFEQLPEAPTKGRAARH